MKICDCGLNEKFQDCLTLSIDKECEYTLSVFPQKPMYVVLFGYILELIQKY
jgi:hypothetical protein